MSGKDESKNQTDALSPIARAYQSLYEPLPQKTVPCMWCGADVPDVGSHIKAVHAPRTLADYATEFKRAPLVPPQRPEPAPSDEPDINVTAAEARKHPGGRQGAINEKQLKDKREQKAYRADVQALIDEGHPPSYEIATIAYLQILARRYRTIIEETRAKAKSTQIVDTAALKELQNIEAKIFEMRGKIDAARLKRLEEERQRAADDPLKLVEDTLLEAEVFCKQNIGEYVLSCPNCNQMLTAPNLPGWAWAPIRTESGVEWPVWSREAWQLLLRRELRLAHMALILRTSPEGLKTTASRRGDDWPEWIVLEEEERALRRYLDEADREALLSGFRPPVESDGGGE